MFFNFFLFQNFRNISFYAFFISASNRFLRNAIFLKFFHENFSQSYYLHIFIALHAKLQLHTVHLRIFVLIQRRVPPENDFSPKHRSVAGLCIGGASFCQAEGRRVENRGNFRATKLSEVFANCICIHQADLLKKNIARKRIYIL